MSQDNIVSAEINNYSIGQNGMPLLEEYSSQVDSDHFNDVQILYINHLISDALMTAAALKKAGAEISIVGIPYGSNDSDERQWVIDGYQAIGSTYLPIVENSLEFRLKMRECVLLALRELDLSKKPLMIIEDGGYAFPILHEPKQKYILESCIGAVEHTARGLWNYQYMEVDQIPQTPRILQRPAITIAATQLKSKHEPIFVAQAVVHELISVLTRKHEFLPFKKVSVLGNGRIGKPIGELIKLFGASVEMIDPRFSNGEDRSNIHPILTQDLFSESTFFVGASGIPSISREQLLSFLKNDTNKMSKFFASASSKNIEFEEVIRSLDDLESDSDLTCSIFGEGSLITKKNIPEFGLQYTLHNKDSQRSFSILGEGYPIIFYPKHTHGGPSKPFDPVMTQQFLAACTLSSKYRCLENKVYSLDETQHLFKSRDQFRILLDDKKMLRRWCELNCIDPDSYFRQIRYG